MSKLQIILILAVIFLVPIRSHASDNDTSQIWTIDYSIHDKLVEMVFVEGGNFAMGNHAGIGWSDEKPVHQVTLTPFFIGKYEITQQQWRTVMGKNPSYFKGSDLPAEMISWYDCIDFCNKLSIMEGLNPCYTRRGANVYCDWSANGYRLPTEAEWEYAARGGEESLGFAYSGSNIADSVAWHVKNSNLTTQLVGSKLPNELGIYDMSGNVWEWCWDWQSNYSSRPQTCPIGLDIGTYRTLRGGSWYLKSNKSRVSYRFSYRPIIRSHGVGLRIVRASL